MKLSDRFAIRLVHLNVGWRYYAWERHTGYAEEVGLDPNGYPTLEAAEQAVASLLEDLS